MTNVRKRQKNIVYFLEGGLGNQAAITAHAFANMPDFGNIRISTFKYLNNSEKRHFEIRKYFDVDGTTVRFLKAPLDKYIYMFMKICAKIFRMETVELQLPGHTFKLGYYQDEMINNVQVIKPYLQIPIKKSPQLSIHVRRGDYTLQKHTSHGLISVDDIKRTAIDIIRNSGLQRINIISEDPNVYENFVDDKDFKDFELHDYTSNDQFDVFCTMLNSSVIIGTNSTFSLLAGSLSDGELWIPNIWDKFRSSSFLGTGANRYTASFEPRD